jgi:hypothetical protein
MRKLIIGGLLSLSAATAFAEPTGSAVSITYLRPYTTTAPFVIMQVTPGSLCDTDTYRIALSEGGGKEIYATALSAFLAGRKVQIEIRNAEGCTGWGTLIQSLYVLNN